MSSTKAVQLKEEGNKYFQAGDYIGAEGLYSKAIIADPTNPLLYTNRAMSRLRLSLWDSVISDSLESISLLPENMKGYYYLAQAQIALHHPNEALQSALQAHEFCVRANDKSITAITALVLRCKKEKWEIREKMRLRGRNTLLEELLQLLDNKKEQEIQDQVSAHGKDGHDERNEDKELREEYEEKQKEIEKEHDDKVEELRRVFEKAGSIGEDGKRRKVPDWCVDDISFGVMLDPVVTKTGQSYDRSSILEHLKRSSTDPLTREPLSVEDLRPNLGLKAACAEFLEEEGWAVDW